MKDNAYIDGNDEDEKNDKIDIRLSKSNIISGFIWKFMERGATQIVSLILSLVLARILTPDDYGIIALILVFVNISMILINNGFSVSLVQKKDADELDFSSVFYFSLGITFVVYALLFISAPYIAKYYNNHELTLMLRVLLLQLFPGAINSVQNAYISRTMQFKRLFLSSFLSTLLSGVIGIILALNNAGVWALVFQSMIASFVVMIVLFITVDWRPLATFSIKRIRQLLLFGSKMLGIGLLDAVFNNLYSIVIGKIFSVEQLGVYNRGQQIPQLLQANIEGAVTGVALPVFSANNDNVDIVRGYLRKFISGCTFIVFPCCLGIAAIAHPLTIVLLTSKWEASIPFLRIFCFVYALYSVNSINVCAFYAIGRSGLVFIIQIIKKVVIVFLLILSARYGVYAIAVSQLIQAVFEFLIQGFYAKKLLGYNFSMQLSDSIPQFLLAWIMFLVVNEICALSNLPTVVTLCIGVLGGGLFYIAISYIFKIKAFRMFIDLVANWRK